MRKLPYPINKISLLLLLFYFHCFFLSHTIAQNTSKWIAPSSASEMKNPFKNDEASLIEGKKVFTSMCVVCHGESGRGNGAASVALTPHPANFLSLEIENESDGAIFWKITEGRPPMASYKTLLTDDQRWKLVTYIRSLQKKDKSNEKKH